ncbi:MAG: hypothetical protein LBM04_13110 [Opitutaceae bacterium]|nr:hypothetical protein [Opitutaceae bacterium]
MSREDAYAKPCIGFANPETRGWQHAIGFSKNAPARWERRHFAGNLSLYYHLMLRSRQILQSLTLCQAANYQCGLPCVRGLTQGQALRNPAIRVTSVKMFFPLFAAALQACLGLAPLLKRSAGCQAC